MLSPCRRWCASVGRDACSTSRGDVLENSAHDSIWGCSADEVSAQVLVRYAEAEEIAAGLATATSSGSRGELSAAGAVVNPRPRTRTDLIEIELNPRGVRRRFP